MFNITYKIESETHYKLIDMIVWNKVKVISSKNLLKYIFKYIKETKPKFSFNKLEHAAEWYTGDLIEFSTKEPISALPSLVIHECLHGIFPQIDDDDYIRTLELRIMKVIKPYQVNRLLHEVLHGRWEYTKGFERRVPPGPTKTCR